MIWESHNPSWCGFGTVPSEPRILFVFADQKPQAKQRYKVVVAWPRMSIDELDVIEAIEVTIPEAWAEARAKEEAQGPG